jgi:GntR family transcriptional repressor for pyruvate dehydrogenase complex
VEVDVMAGCLVGGIRAPVGKCGALSGARPGHLVPLVASEAVDRADKGPTVSTRWSYTRLTRHLGERTGGIDLAARRCRAENFDVGRTGAIGARTAGPDLALVIMSEKLTSGGAGSRLEQDVGRDPAPQGRVGSVESRAKEPVRGATAKVIGQKVLRPREQVEEKIRAAILSGELRSGERLPPESELARQFDVSRTTVREALRSLVTQNLIDKMPGVGGGNFVRSVDHRSLGNLLQESLHNLLQLGSLRADEVAMVRQYLEAPSARLAAEHRSEEDLASLRKIVDQQKTISVDDPEVPELDARFHAAIAKASGNRVLASFVHALHRETEPVHYLDLNPEVGRRTVRQHQKIVKAIAASDPDAAERAVIEHLTYLREHLFSQ